MLIGFSVANFRSFYKQQVLTLKANKGTRLEDHVYRENKHKLLRGTLIYGANASGKSNLIKAVSFSRNIVLSGLDQVDSTGCNFRLNAESFKEPGIFEYRILVGGQEYSYGVVISYANKEIVDEWLTRIESAEKSYTIFERSLKDGISTCETDVPDSTEDGKRLNLYIEDFQEHISDEFRKKTVLSDIATRGNGRGGIFDEISAVYQWFKNILILTPNSKYNSLGEFAGDQQGHSIFTKYLNGFDTGIEDIQAQTEKISIEKLLESLPSEIAERFRIDIAGQPGKQQVWVINGQLVRVEKTDDGSIVYNKLILDHGNKENLFEYKDESDGTRRIFDLIPLLYTETDNKVVFIDEIDRSLHSMLTRHFIQSYYEVAKKKKCQLIATSHDSSLMDLDLVRQDEIWFVNRNKDHSTELYPLDKFKVRFDKDIEKDYLIGRYGGVPALRDLWPEE